MSTLSRRAYRTPRSTRLNNLNQSAQRYSSPVVFERVAEVFPTPPDLTNYTGVEPGVNRKQPKHTGYPVLALLNGGSILPTFYEAQQAICVAAYPVIRAAREAAMLLEMTRQTSVNAANEKAAAEVTLQDEKSVQDLLDSIFGGI